MAHFAKLNEQNVVVQVIVIRNEDTSDEYGAEKEEIGKNFCKNLFGGDWVQTSYNGSFRKNFASLGSVYRPDLDAFVSPKPFASYVLNEMTARWESPIPMPEDAGTGDPPKVYSWDEATTSWKEEKTEGM